MDTEQARFNMVEQQIRTWEVLDPEVLDLLFTVRREEFVPPEYRTLAFADLEIPLTASAKPVVPVYGPPALAVGGRFVWTMCAVAVADAPPPRPSETVSVTV